MERLYLNGGQYNGNTGCSSEWCMIRGESDSEKNLEDITWVVVQKLAQPLLETADIPLVFSLSGKG